MAATKFSSRKTTRFVLGREHFEKISAVEGITTDADTKRMFRDFDRKGLSAEQRRRAIFEKHARKA